MREIEIRPARGAADKPWGGPRTVPAYQPPARPMIAADSLR